jgi:5-oxoprolinase (ATP-hydrolysing)
MKYQFAIDRGGTFTDVFARCPDGTVKTIKLLSEDPSNYADAPTEGIRRVLGAPAGVPVDPSQIEWIRMGTTVATNALLERKGERMALVVTKGFKDLLYIGECIYLGVSVVLHVLQYNRKITGRLHYL